MSLLSYASTILRRSAALRFPLQWKSCVNQFINIPSRSLATTTLHDVNTNVIKDVILFKYENPKFFMYMNVFAIVQYMFWTYLGIFAFSTLRDAPVDKTKVTDETPWFRKINLGENKYRNTLGSLAVVIGKSFDQMKAYSNCHTYKSVVDLDCNRNTVTFILHI